MSMLGGLMGGSDSTNSYMPMKAPKVPKRSDEGIDNKVMARLRNLASKDSYSQTLLGGSAAPPAKSYTSQMYAGGM